MEEWEASSPGEAAPSEVIAWSISAGAEERLILSLQLLTGPGATTVLRMALPRSAAVSLGAELERQIAGSSRLC